MNLDDFEKVAGTGIREVDRDESIEPVEFDGSVAFSEIMELMQRDEVWLEVMVPAYRLLPGESGRIVTSITLPGGGKFSVPGRLGGLRIGVPKQYYPRKGTLRVEIPSMPQPNHFEIMRENVRHAYVGPKGDTWKYEVV